MRLDALSQAELENTDDDNLQKKMTILEDFAQRPREAKERLLTLRFLVSPTKLIAGDDGGVRAIRIVSNELISDGGKLRPRATEQTEELPVDLVFRSVGYRGLPVEGLPFNESWGVVPNESGRVTEPETGRPVRGDVRQRLDQAWPDRGDRNEQKRRDGDRRRHAERRRIVLRPRSGASRPMGPRRARSGASAPPGELLRTGADWMSWSGREARLVGGRA